MLSLSDSSHWQNDKERNGMRSPVMQVLFRSCQTGTKRTMIRRTSEQRIRMQRTEETMHETHHHGYERLKRQHGNV